MSNRKHHPDTVAMIADVDTYIRRLADLMGLQRWDVYVSVKPSRKDALATVDPVQGRAVASVRIARDFHACSTADQVNTLVHELIHLIHRDQTDIIRVATAGGEVLGTQATYDLLWSTVKLATEVMVDHLAAIIAPTMPLPPWARDTPTGTVSSTDTPDSKDT